MPHDRVDNEDRVRDDGTVSPDAADWAEKAKLELFIGESIRDSTVLLDGKPVGCTDVQVSLVAGGYSEVRLAIAGRHLGSPVHIKGALQVIEVGEGES